MPQALVLNATYEPLSAVPTRRAVVLLVRDKAELVEPQGGHWSSERLRVPVHGGHRDALPSEAADDPQRVRPGGLEDDGPAHPAIAA